MENPQNPQYWISKKARKKTGFPIATIAFYGPDNSFASKVTTGILLSEKDKEVSELKRWLSTGEDVRKDKRIMQEIYEFLEQYHVQRAVMTENIIGCPHEEGIDYPEGEVCPQCPYWADRDRWTGEKLNQ